jgi:hypothetical protein
MAQIADALRAGAKHPNERLGYQHSSHAEQE